MTLDLLGTRFGLLSVVERTRQRSRDGDVLWRCVCECETECLVSATYLRRGKVRSCGCLQKKVASLSAKDLSGMTFGRLVVRERTGSNSAGRALWLCDCKCGQDVVVEGKKLTAGHTRSCGCLRWPTDRRHPRWNDSLTDEDRLSRRFQSGYSRWRLCVYERDGYTCVLCGDDRGGNLVAHHLDGWNWCKEKRLDVENGVTLCEECHDLFHLRFGNGENTKEQFLEFAKENRGQAKSAIQEMA